MKTWIILIILALLVSACFFLVPSFSNKLSSDELSIIESEDILNAEANELCTEGEPIPKDSECKCKEGYVRDEFLYYYQNEEKIVTLYYCKIDKQWSDFETCNADGQCPQDYRCISKWEDTQTDAENTRDFRCVPPQMEYKMTQWCTFTGCVSS